MVREDTNHGGRNFCEDHEGASYRSCIMASEKTNNLNVVREDTNHGGREASRDGNIDKETFASIMKEHHIDPA
jgi:hypothetical protein